MLPCSDPAGALFDISWKSSTVNCKQSRRSLEGGEDDFLTQVTNSLIRGEALPALFLITRNELISKDKTQTAAIPPGGIQS